MNNYREILYRGKGEMSYEMVLEKVQQFMPSVLDVDVDDVSEDELKEKISKYLADYNIKSNLTDSINELTNYLYHDMAGASFITREKIFEMDGFEELDINSWEDVDIVVNGQAYKTDYKFLSPQHAIDVHTKLLRKTSASFDDAMPMVVTDLGINIRIAVMKTPLVDENVGITSSIRKVDSSIATREAIIGHGTLTEDMLMLLELAGKNGISICYSGETGAGKTFLAGYILSEIAKQLRTFTIEEGSREWNFVRRDENNKITNSVIHTKTRPSEDEKLNISQNELLMITLRFNPTVIGVGEIRSKESYTATEAARTGHSVITTIHADSAEDTPSRILELAKKAHDFNDATLLSMITKAFPLIVYIEKLADHTRRVTEILEITGYKNGEILSSMIYEYQVENNIYTEVEDKELNFVGTKIETIGKFVKVNNISKSLAQKMLRKGATKEQISKFTGDVLC